MPTRSRTDIARSLRAAFERPLSPNITFCSTFRCGNSASSWKTKPTRRCAGRTNRPLLASVATLPPMLIWPASGDSKPAISRSSVVLPQPEAPEMLTISPGRTRNDTSLTAGTGESGYVLLTPVNCMTGLGSRPECTGQVPPEAQLVRRFLILIISLGIIICAGTRVIECSQGAEHPKRGTNHAQNAHQPGGAAARGQRLSAAYRLRGPRRGVRSARHRPFQ